MTENPVSIKNLLAMDSIQREVWGVDEDPELQSLLKAATVLAKLPIASLQETERWSLEDMQSIDITGQFDSVFQSMTSIDKLNAQIKSSEAGISKLICIGIHKNLFPNWRDKRLLVINGRMSTDLVAADVISQIMNYMGVTSNNLSRNAFLETLDPMFKSSFYAAQRSHSLTCRLEWYTYLNQI